MGVGIASSRDLEYGHLLDALKGGVVTATLRKSIQILSAMLLGRNHGVNGLRCVASHRCGVGDYILVIGWHC